MKVALFSAAALALAGAAVMGSEWRSIENAAAADLRGILGADHVTVRAESDGLIGTAMGSVSEVSIFASGFNVEGMPLFSYPHLSQKGRMRTLNIVLQNFVIRDLPVRELACSIPNNRFAIGLLRAGKVRLTRSGEGTGSVEIDEEGLKRYILAKFAVVDSIEIVLDRYKLIAKGTASIALLKRDFEIICDLVIAEKRRLDIANPIVFIGGNRVRDGSEASLVRALNPVLDLDRDLGLAGAFDMQKVVVKGGTAKIYGAARIPTEPRSQVSP